MTNINKITVRVLNRNSETLVGILTSPSPESKYKKDIIIFSQVGIVTKTGMGDHLRILSDKLAENGYTTLRFDQRGTGDSQGEIDACISISQLFRKVQNGLFKNDLVDIIDWVIKEFSNYRIFLFGECGGCITSLFACTERTNYFAGLMMLAFPVLLYPIEDDDQHEKIRDFDSKIIIKIYADKILNFNSWTRLLSGRSNVRLIKQLLQSYFSRCFKKILNQLPWERSKINLNHERFNWKFWDAFQVAIKEEIPICFLMPELDNETFEFDIEFKQKVLDKENSSSRNCSVNYLPLTDHSIMFKKSRSYLLQQTINWIEKVTGDR